MTSTYHVSHVVGGSLSGPSTPTYRRVNATSPGAAIDAVSRELGNPATGEWRAQLVDADEDVGTSRLRLAA